MAEERDVVVQTEDAALEGTLAIPAGAHGVVVFAHGSGSSRFSRRNRFVAQELRRAGLGTLLMDLLTPEEGAIDERTRQLRFDIPLLGKRVVGALDWLGRHRDARHMPIGTFGASTGAAAALIAAASRPERVGAVVSRGGRPDLAGLALERVACPTLFVVGGDDTQVIALNEKAAASMRVQPHFEIVPGAGHLFEEPGTLERVAELAGSFFRRHLTAPASTTLGA